MSTTRGTWPPAPKGEPRVPDGPPVRPDPGAAETSAGDPATRAQDVGGDGARAEAGPAGHAGLLPGPRDKPGSDEPIFESLRDLFDRDNLEAAVRRKVATMRTRIGALWPDMSATARTIVERIAEEEAVDRDLVAAEWIVQRALFLEIGRHFGLERVEAFAPVRADCFLALTERGSLITASEPDRKGRRQVEYIRIPSRAGSWQRDVSVRGPVEEIRSGHRAKLPGMRTSPVQYVLVVPAKRRGEFSRIAHLTRTGIRSTLVGGG